MNRDTHETLNRLQRVLVDAINPKTTDGLLVVGQIAKEDAESLRKISMTLHRWHELECGTDAGCIERCEETGKPHWRNQDGWWNDKPVQDREAGALRRLKRIMDRYPTLEAYVQTDPRGCALYILRPGDVPAGSKPDECYSRGIAVHK